MDRDQAAGTWTGRLTSLILMGNIKVMIIMKDLKSI